MSIDTLLPQSCLKNENQRGWLYFTLMQPPTQTAFPDLQVCFHGHQPKRQHKYSVQPTG